MVTARTNGQLTSRNGSMKFVDCFSNGQTIGNSFSTLLMCLQFLLICNFSFSGWRWFASFCCPHSTDPFAVFFFLSHSDTDVGLPVCVVYTQHYHVMRFFCNYIFPLLLKFSTEITLIICWLRQLLYSYCLRTGKFIVNFESALGSQANYMRLALVSNFFSIYNRKKAQQNRTYTTSHIWKLFKLHQPLIFW